MANDEQLRLLQEALHWAMTTLRSNQAQCEALAASGDGGPAEAEKVEAARQRLNLAQQTVDELRGRIADRERELQAAPRS